MGTRGFMSLCTMVGTPRMSMALQSMYGTSRPSITFIGTMEEFIINVQIIQWVYVAIKKIVGQLVRCKGNK